MHKKGWVIDKTVEWQDGPCNSVGKKEILEIEV